MMIRCAECHTTQDGDYIEHEEVDGKLVCEDCLTTEADGIASDDESAD